MAFPNQLGITNFNFISGARRDQDNRRVPGPATRDGSLQEQHHRHRLARRPSKGEGPGRCLAAACQTSPPRRAVRGCLPSLLPRPNYDLGDNRLVPQGPNFRQRNPPHLLLPARDFLPRHPLHLRGDPPRQRRLLLPSRLPPPDRGSDPNEPRRGPPRNVRRRNSPDPRPGGTPRPPPEHRRCNNPHADDLRPLGAPHRRHGQGRAVPPGERGGGRRRSALRRGGSDEDDHADKGDRIGHHLPLPLPGKHNLRRGPSRELVAQGPEQGEEDRPVCWCFGNRSDGRFGRRRKGKGWDRRRCWQ